MDAWRRGHDDLPCGDDRHRRSGACAIKTQFLNTVESSKWAYYQAKSIKQNLAETQKNQFEIELVGATHPQQRALYEEKLKVSSQEIARYDAEKNQIRKEAEATGALNIRIAKKGNFFSGAVVFFQIGIMLSSVSALLKRKSMWVVGLLFGTVATALLGYGLFIKPLLF